MGVRVFIEDSGQRDGVSIGYACWCVCVYVFVCVCVYEMNLRKLSNILLFQMHQGGVFSFYFFRLGTGRKWEVQTYFFSGRVRFCILLIFCTEITFYPCVWFFSALSPSLYLDSLFWSVLLPSYPGLFLCSPYFTIEIPPAQLLRHSCTPQSAR